MEMLPFFTPVAVAFFGVSLEINMVTLNTDTSFLKFPFIVLLDT
jgi:hypothetical protein